MIGLRSATRMLMIAAVAGMTLNGGATSASAKAVASSSTIAGLEVSATSTQGRFVGVAVAQGPHGLAGAWSTTVKHRPLTKCMVGTPCADITGGTFQLDTAVDGHLLKVKGQLDTPNQAQAANLGSVGIVLVNAPSRCGKQVYTVTNGLTAVGASSLRTGTGHITVRLTHYRLWLFGRCIIYAASITGTLDLIF